MNNYFFDTYALIEIYKSNPKYEKYQKEIGMIINKLNLLEYTYFLMREGKQSEMKEIFEKLSRFNVDYDNELLVEAAKMKLKFLKERLSFIDCIGYLLAKKHSAKFLTGDEKFKHKENVEFVK